MPRIRKPAKNPHLGRPPDSVRFTKELETRGNVKKVVNKYVVAMWDKISAIHAAGDDVIPETRGGRMREYNSLSYALCKAMRCNRWQGHPIECNAPIENAPGYIQANHDKAEMWSDGYAARRLLERASRA